MTAMMVEAQKSAIAVARLTYISRNERREKTLSLLLLLQPGKERERWSFK
jgi:hypothetical protein